MPGAVSPRSTGEAVPLPALLLIDVQRGLDDPGYGTRNNPEAERRMAELLAAWRNGAGAMSAGR